MIDNKIKNKIYYTLTKLYIQINISIGTLCWVWKWLHGCNANEKIHNEESKTEWNCIEQSSKISRIGKMTE